MSCQSASAKGCPAMTSCLSSPQVQAPGLRFKVSPPALRAHPAPASAGLGFRVWALGFRIKGLFFKMPEDLRVEELSAWQLASNPHQAPGPQSQDSSPT